MTTHGVLLAIRIVGFIVAGIGIVALGREQRVTAGRDLPLRPRFIALWIGLFVVGVAASVAAILLQ